MRRLLYILGLVLLVASIAGCVGSELTDEQKATAKIQETQKLKPLTYSAEREAMLLWYELVNDPYNVQWVYVFSEGTGQLMFKSPIVGKVVSIRKSLGPKTRDLDIDGRNEASAGRRLFGAREGTAELMNPSGTYGPDLPGVFFFTPEGQYIEIHSGIIMVSSQPISVQAPVININSINEEDAKKEREYEEMLKDPKKNPLMKMLEGVQ